MLGKMISPCILEIICQAREFFWLFKFKTFKLLCFPGIPPKLLNLEIFKMGNCYNI